MKYINNHTTMIKNVAHHDKTYRSCHHMGAYNSEFNMFSNKFFAAANPRNEIVIVLASTKNPLPKAKAE
jgi:hypothetical protein